MSRNLSMVGIQSSVSFHNCTSGKIRILEGILADWHASGHRVLLFCQTRQMLDIIERLVRQHGKSSSLLGLFFCVLSGTWITRW